MKVKRLTKRSYRNFSYIPVFSVFKRADWFASYHKITYLWVSWTKLAIKLGVTSKSWWSDDIIPPEDTDIDSVTIMYGLQQLISEPTHQWQSSLSCIDLMFTDLPNLAVDVAVHSSLHPNGHHQIIYCKFNHMTEHLPEYERLVSDYNCSNHNAIAKALV